MKILVLGMYLIKLIEKYCGFLEMLSKSKINFPRKIIIKIF
jgi:hypothetical protein